MMKRLFSKPFSVLALILALLPLIAACAGHNVVTISKPGPGIETLAGSSWVFSSFMTSDMTAQVALPGQELTLTFDLLGNADGFAGCNKFFATYSITGAGLSFSNIGATRKVCAEATMAQEAAFIAALGNATSFAVLGSTLNVNYSSNQSLQFIEPSQTYTDPLSGTAWKLDMFYTPALGSFGLMDKTSISLRFTNNGRVSGFAGCNTYFGDYTVAGERLLVSNITTSENPCDPNVRDQENAYLSALERAKMFIVDGMQLSVEHVQGKELHYSLQES